MLTCSIAQENNSVLLHSQVKNHSNYTVVEMNEIATTIIWLSQLFIAVHTELCGSFSPVYGMTLKRHVFQVLRVPNSRHCLKACNNDIRCQSVNHLMGKDICELNNRTKEATPEDLISDINMMHMTRPNGRGKHHAA